MDTTTTYDYDFAVIGGGSGGMACAKEAASFGVKVVLFDFVSPTIHGTKWGLGGTCVNVGCIPKKLMHYAARIGDTCYHDANKYGWMIDTDSLQCDWPTLVQNVQNYIKSLNFSYRVGLRNKSVQYINARAALEDAHTVSYTLKGEMKTLSSKFIVIAVGGRPYVPSDIPGAVEFSITSDDLFSMKNSPGKVLSVGASYISLECAGFLTPITHDVTVAVRSILLRGFDRQCSEKVGKVMAELGTKFLYGVTVTKITKTENGEFSVLFSNGHIENFNTVIWAAGRQAATRNMGLEKVGVRLSAPLNKVITDDEDRTSVENIFAIGDIQVGRPELTPTAIRAGELLARRLFGGKFEKMRYELVPTTVFTPVEYGSCGVSEETAVEKYGAELIETYLFEYNPLEFSASHREKALSERKDEMDTDMSVTNLSKLVCVKPDLRVVGFHCVSPNAGEITQGFALAMACGVTKSHFDNLVGIHPTDAESFMDMQITRSSGQTWIASGGCGGGKCG